ncbi:MAG: ASKHA domain-containing protein [Roseburia sp.]|nr:ASKHA domain-containing protein [Roseburia sp.]MCM1097084.1 ASKHA domain-containing protein [Ruminococcus flavefaciens]
MYRGKKGLRCRVCTGCGLCPGVTPESRAEGIRVLAEEGFGESEALSGYPEESSGKKPEAGERALHFSGHRLVTADIGTTTVAMLLYGADGSVEDRFLALNPQRKYGADVISRIRAAEDPEKAEEMCRRIRQVLAEGLERFRRKLGENETIFLTVAANTTMNYLLTGRDPAELGRAPFHASCFWEEQTEIEGAPCFRMPGLSAFLGGDVLAGMLACGMGEREEIQLLLDLGTNGELVLGNRERRIACATAAGPAFEGGPAAGIWGADMVSLLAALRREGLLDETGLLAEPYFKDGVRVGNVLITQEAVRAVQLAKAAVAAGIEILLERYGIGPEQVDRVILAGGLGYYLNPEDAALIGLLPAVWKEKAVAGGNTALAGALLAGRELLRAEAEEAGEQRSGSALEVARGVRNGSESKGNRRSEDSRQRLAECLRKLAEGTECLNLAEEKDFGPRYIERMELKEFLFDSAKL